MTRLFFVLTLILTAIIQATLLPWLGLFGFTPNFVLVLILVWSSLRGVNEGIIWAFGVGLFLDILALDPLGFNGLTLLPVAIIGGLSRGRFFRSNLIVPMVVALGATIAHQVVVTIVGGMTGAVYPVMVSFRLGLLLALINVLLVPPLYVVLMLLDRMGVGDVAKT